MIHIKFWNDLCSETLMELYDFISLPVDDRATTVWNQGVYLCTRRSTHGYVNLYGIESFYVEVFFHTEYNEIDDIRCFQCVCALDPYLELIEISLRDFD